MDEHTREPCPMRIFDDIGGAFSMGAIGGAIFHAYKGRRNAASGQRLVTMYRYVVEKAPVTGGQFAAWGGMFSATDCTLVWMRKKEDYWNSIIAGGFTGAALTVRAGPVPMAASAAIGAVMLAAIEGVGLMMTKFTAPAFDPTLAAAVEDPSALPDKPGSSSSSGGGGGSTIFNMDDTAFQSSSSTSDEHSASSSGVFSGTGLPSFDGLSPAAGSSSNSGGGGPPPPASGSGGGGWSWGGLFGQTNKM